LKRAASKTLHTLYPAASRKARRLGAFASLESGLKLNTNTTFRRTREIEEFSNLYFIHPIAARLTPVLAAVGVSPNTVSLTGMLCGILAGWAYFYYQDLRYAAAGFVLMIAWHILDGVDGQLARLTNRQSKFGKVIDGIADSVTFFAVYLGLGLAMQEPLGGWVWLAITGAAVTHSLQSATYEFQRQEYDTWVRGKNPVEFSLDDMPDDKTQPDFWLQRIIYTLGNYYVRLQHRLDPGSTRHRHRLARALAAQPARAEFIRGQYRETFSSLVRYWSVMSSNYHTLLIFICAALNAPLWYFFIELFGMTPLTLVLLRCQKTRIREFSRFLDREAL